MRSAGEVTRARRRPRHAGEAWRARIGVVLQSWRDHPQWTPRRLLDQLGWLLRAVLHAASAAAAVGRRRPARRRSGLTELRRPQDRDPLRRPAAPARRRDRHRRPPGAAVPRRARPPASTRRPARVPRPGAPAGRARARPSCSPPTTSTRPRSSPTGSLILAGGRIVADGSPRRAWPGGWRASRRCAGPRTASGSCTPTDDATAFVRELFARARRGRSRDLEVRRASLEDTYLTLVQQHEAGQADEAAAATLRGGGHPVSRQPDAPRGAARPAPRVVRVRAERPQHPGPGLLPVHGGLVRRLPLAPARRDTEVEGTDLSRPSALPSILGALIAFGVVVGPGYALAMEKEDGTLLRHQAVPHGWSATSPVSFSSRP